ncbi:hypothetical protein BCR35DRAFT_301307, partial [Leucosporidium creatinivorum]
MDWYDLDSWELEENLYYKLAPNPYGGPLPMKLFVQKEVEQLARELRGNQRDWQVPPPFGSPSPSNRDRNAYTGTNRNRNIIEIDDSDEEGEDEEEDEDLTPLISATTARSSYKLTLGELSTLDPVRTEPNANGPGQMRLYDEEEVQELAFFLHGGKTGHAAYVRQLKKSAEKAHNTRIKNAIRREKEEQKRLKRKQKAAKVVKAAKARKGREDDVDEEE